MKSLLIIALLGISIPVMAANTSANHGHHGGGNNGALGSSAGTHQGQSSKSSSGNSQTGNGGMGDCDVTHYSICTKE